MSKPVGIVLKSVKRPKDAATFIVEDYKNSTFLHPALGLRWLRQRIEKEIEERDALILGDVNDSLGGTV